MCGLLGVMENPPWTLRATLTGREDVKPSTQRATDLHGPSARRWTDGTGGLVNVNSTLNTTRDGSMGPHKMLSTPSLQR